MKSNESYSRLDHFVSVLERSRPAFRFFNVCKISRAVQEIASRLASAAPRGSWTRSDIVPRDRRTGESLRRKLCDVSPLPPPLSLFSLSLRRPRLVHHEWSSMPSRSFDSFAREREEAIDTRSDCQDRVTTLSRDAWCVHRSCASVFLDSSETRADDNPDISIKADWLYWETILSSRTRTSTNMMNYIVQLVAKVLLLWKQTSLSLEISFTHSADDGEIYKDIFME